MLSKKMIGNIMKNVLKNREERFRFFGNSFQIIF
jgi:hypothetical protein